MRISDWISDVCSSDLYYTAAVVMIPGYATNTKYAGEPRTWGISARYRFGAADGYTWRSEEHTSELQSLMRISYAVFCLKKKIHIITNNKTHHSQNNHTITTPNTLTELNNVR